MKFRVANKYLREANKTFVAIRCDEPYTAYDRVLEGDRNSFGDIVSAPYPYDTNPKYPQGTPVILKFLDNWTHKGQPLQELLQKGACTTIMPKLN